MLPCLAALLLMNGGSAFAQFRLNISALDSPVSASSDKRSPARGAQSKSIRIGEQLPLRLELANEGGQPVEARASVDPAAGFVTLYLSGPGPDAKPQRFTVNRWEIKEIFVKPRVLASGEKVVHETFLYGIMGTNFQVTYLFPQQGDYRLHAVYDSQVPPLHLESEALLIHVGPPIDDWEELKKARLVELMEGRLDSHQKVSASLDKVQSLMSRHAQHPLQTWVAAKSKSLAPDRAPMP